MKAEQGQQVLIVDDNHDDLRLLSQYLTRPGLDVRVSMDADQALGMIDRCPPDLIVLDCKLPGMDGFELCRRLQADVAYRHIPVLFVSALTDSQDMVRGLEAGAVDFIRKPVVEAEITARIQRHLQQSKPTGCGPECAHRHGQPADSADASLPESATERFFHRLIERVNSVFWIASYDWQQLHYVNPAYESVWGCPADSLTTAPLSWLDVLASGDQRTVRQLLERTRDETPDVVNMPDYRLVLPDGSLKWIQTKGYKIEADPSGTERYAWVSTDISERKSNEQNLNYLANHDPLTGLRNRLQLAERVENEILRSRRRGYQLSLLMIDVDHFKSVNDRYGHVVGDRALCALAEVLKRTVRSIDTAFRFGGEEFVVMLPEESLEQALQVAERIRQLVTTQTIELEDQSSLGLTVSIGVAVFPQDGEDYDSLIREADRRLFTAKQGGRDCVNPEYA